MMLKLAQANINKSAGGYLMNMSNARQYPVALQRQVINDGVSAKTVYQWVRSNDLCQIRSKSAIVSEIAHLQQKITQLSQQLHTMAS
jgi:transposase